MAVTNWVGGDGTGTQQTDWTRAANWDNGVPGSGDDAVIGNVTYDPTIPDGTDPTLGSIQVTTGGQLTAGNNVITLDDVDGSGLAFYLNGTGAFVKGTSTITFTGSSNQYIAINTSNANRTFYNVTVNKTGSGDVYIYQSRDGSSNEPLVISNDLTITARGFNTANDSSSPSAYSDLTVTKQCNLAGTLTCNSSTVSVGSGLTNTLGMRVQGGGTLIGGTGPHTYGTFNADASGTINVTLTSNTTTINGSYSDGIAWGMRSGPTFSNGGGDIHFTGSGNQYLYERNNTARTLGDVTVNKSGGNFQWYDGGGAHYTMASLTITQGTFDTNEHDGANPIDLTVADVVTVNGTLTGNSSTLTFGSLKGTGTFNAPTTTVEIDDRDESTGKALDVDGMTIATNDLNVTLTSAKNQDLDIGDDKIHDLTINNDTDARINYLAANGSIDGDLTITRGIFDTFNRTLTVDGDCSIAADGKLEANVNGGKDVTLGSLTIASGGIYNATRETTTITSENGSGFAIQNSGTFTHNNGLVNIDLDTPTTTQASNGPYYDFTQSDAATDFYPAEAFEVMNNLSFVGDFEFQNNAHHLTVHGNMTIGDGTTTTRYMPYHTRTCNLTVGGILEVTNGATLTNFSHGTINVGGVRNTGGTM